MIVTKSKAPAVDGAMQILQLLAQSTSSLSLSEISEESNLPYSTTHRLIDALLAHNMISIDPSEKKKYCMGAKIFQLASTVFSRQDSISIFHPIAEILKNETYNSVYLNIEVGNRTVVIAKTESSMAKASNVFIGSTFPTYQSAAGKAILSTRSKTVQETYLEHIIPKGLDKTVRLESVLAEIQQAKRLGYAIEHAQGENQMSSIAAPVLNMYNHALAAISVGVNRVEFTPQKVREVAAHLIQATRQLSSRLS